MRFSTAAPCFLLKQDNEKVARRCWPRVNGDIAESHINDKRGNVVGFSVTWLTLFLAKTDIFCSLKWLWIF